MTIKTMDCYWYRRLGDIISQWTSSSLFIPRGDNVFSLCIKWASLAFLTASRLLRRSSSGIRMTSLIKCPASLAHLQARGVSKSHHIQMTQFLIIHWTGLCKEHVCRINFLSRNYYYTTYVCVWLCVTKEILVLYHNDIDDKFSYCF